MGSRCKSIRCLKILSSSVAAFPYLLRNNLSMCKGMTLAPDIKAFLLQSALRSINWLDLDGTADHDPECSFPSASCILHPKGYRIMTKYITYIQYLPSRVCTEGMDEMGIWS